MIIFAVVGTLVILFLDRRADRDEEDGDEEKERE